MSLKISQDKGNQAMKFVQLSHNAMKFDQLMEYTSEILNYKNYAENKAGRLVPDHILFFEKDLQEVKASDLYLSYNVFQQHSTWHTIKTNCVKLQTIDPDMLNCDCLEKGLGIVCPTHFAYDF